MTKKLQEHLHTQWPGTWRLALFEKEQNYRCVWRDDRRSRHTIALYLEDGHYASGQTSTALQRPRLLH